MAIRTSGRQSNIEMDMRDYMLRWFRYSNDAVSKSMKVGQPVMEAYLKSLSGAVSNYDKAYRKSCEIPETARPTVLVKWIGTLVRGKRLPGR